MTPNAYTSTDALTCARVLCVERSSVAGASATEARKQMWARTLYCTVLQPRPRPLVCTFLVVMSASGAT